MFVAQGVCVTQEHASLSHVCHTRCMCHTCHTFAAQSVLVKQEHHACHIFAAQGVFVTQEHHTCHTFATQSVFVTQEYESCPTFVALGVFVTQEKTFFLCVPVPKFCLCTTLRLVFGQGLWRCGGLGSRPIFKKFHETYAPS